MDFWKFPTGTKVWKEFSRGGRRIETRLLQKTGEDETNTSWYMVSFQWDQAEGDATAVPSGVSDPDGVNDIPDRSKCRICHQSSRNPSVILGFQAMQLDYAASEALFDLDNLVQLDLLTVEPTGGSASTAYFPLEAESGTPVIEPAVGYLHGNCGGCHNPHSDVVTNNNVDVELRLVTAAANRATWATTPTYTTAVNQTASLGSAGTHIVKGGDTAQSAIHNRMDIDTGGIAMPPQNTRETRDTAAITAVDAWINSLPAPN
jgi:hypothetical protein